MSEVFENNMKFAPFYEFYNNHKTAIISVVTIIIALISISFVMSI